MGQQGSHSFHQPNFIFTLDTSRTTHFEDFKLLQFRASLSISVTLWSQAHINIKVVMKMMVSHFAAVGMHGCAGRHLTMQARVYLVRGSDAMAIEK